MDQLRYDGRVAIVTGGARGIGREHVRLLASRGAKIVVADLGGAVSGGGSDSGPADEAVAEIRDAGGEAVACCSDVGEEAGGVAIVHTALDAFGRIDVVVNNAGIHVPGDFPDLTIDQYESMIAVHFIGTVNVCRAAWPHLVEAGYGRVVNTTSESIVGGVEGSTAYGSAKAAVFGFTRALAREGAPHDVRVNAIAPRAHTRMSQARADAMEADPNVPDEAVQRFREMLHPRHCAPAVGFLAHESCQLDGEVLISGMERVYRLVLVRSAGLVKPEGEVVTPEDIAANLDSIMDLADPLVPTPLRMDP